MTKSFFFFLLFLFLLLFLLLQKILHHFLNANTHGSQRLTFFLIPSLCLHNTTFIFCLFHEYTAFRQRTSIFRTTKQSEVFYNPFQFFWEEVQPTYYPRIQNSCWWGRYRRSILFFTLLSFTLLREIPTLVFSGLLAFDWMVIEWSRNDCATVITRPLTHRFMIAFQSLHHRV